MKNKNKAALLFSTLSILSGGLPNIEPKHKKKCLFHNCDNLTSHNGGYCSAECCKKHKKEQKNK